MTPTAPPLDPRIADLLTMLRSVSRATDPREVLLQYSEGIRALYGTTGFISVSCRDLRPGQYRITRMLTDDNMADIGRDDPWRDRHRLAVHSGGLVGQILGDGVPTITNDLRCAEDPVLGDALAGYRSMLATPLFDGGEALNWALQFRREPDGFTPRDLEDFLMRGNLVGGTVRLVQAMRRLREAGEVIRKEVEKIASIQRALLPAELPAIHGASVAVTYETFDEAGGDYYNVHPLGVDGLLKGDHDGRWGMMVADVSGHGPAAAVVMAMLQSVLMCLPVEYQDSAGVLDFLNRHLCAKRIEQTFVTAFVIGYDPADGRLWYARAGHPPAMVRRVHADGSTEILKLGEVGGVPLGILDDETYHNAEFTLRPGDTVVLYTDGIAEARDPRGGFFGEEGIERALLTCSGEADCFIRTLKQQLLDHEGGARPQDDQTALAFRVNRIGERPATFTSFAQGAGI